LTIYFDEKNKNGELVNIFLNEKKTNSNDSQTTFAKTATINVKNNTKILTLYDGKTINVMNGKISEFEFSKTDYNISKSGSNTIMHPKTQEMTTTDLIRCSLFLKDSIKNGNVIKINNCMPDNLKNIYQELYSRLIKPLYVTFLISIALLFILKSKNDHEFNINKNKIYLFTFIFIIFLESSSKFISTNMIQNLFLSILPILFTLFIYLYFLMKLKVSKT